MKYTRRGSCIGSSLLDRIKMSVRQLLVDIEQAVIYMYLGVQEESLKWRYKFENNTDSI